jgi:hypothetical protein
VLQVVVKREGEEKRHREAEIEERETERGKRER